MWFVRFQIAKHLAQGSCTEFTLQKTFAKILEGIILLRSISSLLLFTFSVLGILPFPTQELFLDLNESSYYQWKKIS